MPRADEKLEDKRVFDVYAALLILSFLFTLGAILVLKAELRSSWYAGADREEAKVAYRLSRENALTPAEQAKRTQPCLEIAVTEEDEDDYFRIKDGGMHADLAFKTREDFKNLRRYPAWLDIYKRPVNTAPDADNVSQLSKEDRDKLVATYPDPTKPPETAPPPAAP